MPLSRASAIAFGIWERHGLAVPVDLRGLVSALGIEVVSFPFRGRLREVIIDGTIGVRGGLDRRWFRWHVAHGIGHHQLHMGARTGRRGLRGLRRQGRAAGRGVRGLPGGGAGRLGAVQRRARYPAREAAPRPGSRGQSVHLNVRNGEDRLQTRLYKRARRLVLTYRAKSRTESHSSSVRSPISVSLASWRSSMGLSYSCRVMYPAVTASSP